MFSDPINNLEQFDIQPAMKVADLGSGSGFYTYAISEIVGKSGTVFSVDVQKNLIEKINNELEERGITNVKTIWGDIDEVGGTSIAEESIDRVVIANVLFQSENVENLIKEAKRILRSHSGKILLIDWSDSFGNLGPTPENIVKEDVARTFFESEGFIFEKNIEAGAHHYGLIFRKP